MSDLKKQKNETHFFFKFKEIKLEKLKIIVLFLVYIFKNLFFYLEILIILLHWLYNDVINVILLFLNLELLSIYTSIKLKLFESHLYIQSLNNE